MTKPLRVGIFGAGQLAQMLSLAAIPLGIKTLCLTPSTNVPAANCSQLLIGQLDDPLLIQQLIDNTDVITVESENIPLIGIEQAHDANKLAPSPQALATTKDRLLEKTCLNNLGITTAPFINVETADDLPHAVTTLGLPIILKTRCFGYDGRGQWLLTTADEVAACQKQFPNQPCIAEGVVDFNDEVSLICARGNHNTVFYPLTHNTHQQGILRYSFAPYDCQQLWQLACEYATKLLSHFNYIGTLAIEFFVKNGQLLVNEIAPRVHNSGHWTIEGSVTSQFENHLRAICNLPLGNTEPLGYSKMINCIGKMPVLSEITAHPYAHLHNYGKSPRANRKLGHITINHPTLINVDDSFVKIKMQLEHNDRS